MPGAYLDHAATTPMRPEAVAAMEPLLGEIFGNPSGSHRWARASRRLLDDARDQVAEVLGARPGEVVFTSGGTESANLAIAGVTRAIGGTALCSAVEHHAVLEQVYACGGRAVAVDGFGRLDLEALAQALTPPEPSAQPGASDGPISIVSVMLANNETGVVNDLAGIVEVVRRVSPASRVSPVALVHTDAIAAASWVDLAEATALADLVSISGHKVGGPKGIGALVTRDGTPLMATTLGGGQERERRSGTPNVAGAVGFAAALAATASGRKETNLRVEALRARLVAELSRSIPDMVETAPVGPGARTPGTLHACFPGIEREALIFLLDAAGIGASWGSSCSSGATEPSHVLTAMGVLPDLATGALRLSLGWCSTDADVDLAVSAIPAAVDQLRAGSRSGTRS